MCKMTLFSLLCCSLSLYGMEKKERELSPEAKKVIEQENKMNRHAKSTPSPRALKRGSKDDVRRQLMRQEYRKKQYPLDNQGNNRQGQ